LRIVSWLELTTLPEGLTLRHTQEVRLVGGLTEAAVHLVDLVVRQRLRPLGALRLPRAAPGELPHQERLQKYN